MNKSYLTKKEAEKRIEDVDDELIELERDQHPNFRMREPSGKQKYAELLLKFNWLEELLKGFDDETEKM